MPKELGRSNEYNVDAARGLSPFSVRLALTSRPDSEVHHVGRQDGADAHPHGRGASLLRGCARRAAVSRPLDQVKYLEFKAVDGSFVVKDKRVHKARQAAGAARCGGLTARAALAPPPRQVPATDMEALQSPLMGLFEKRRARSFFLFVQGYVDADPKTHAGLDLRRLSMKDVFEHFGLAEVAWLKLSLYDQMAISFCFQMPGTTEFIGHCLALQRTDAYLAQAALPTVLAVKLYADSMARFGAVSPYIYPLYGLGELPQAFARLSAVYGGTYMLNKPGCEPVFGDDGKVVGVRSGDETAKAPIVVGDPSYFTGKTKRVFAVARAMCLLSSPLAGTNEAASAQVIIPYKQVPGRANDIYVFCCSSAHNVVAKGKTVAFVSTRLEGPASGAAAELAPGLALFGSTIDHGPFIIVSDVFHPLADGKADGCFISKGYDETSHFEGLTADVESLYKRITGRELDLTAKPGERG